MFNIASLIFEVLQLKVFTCFIAVDFVICCFLLVMFLFKRDR